MKEQELIRFMKLDWNIPIIKDAPITIVLEFRVWTILLLFAHRQAQIRLKAYISTEAKKPLKFDKVITLHFRC